MLFLPEDIKLVGNVGVVSMDHCVRLAATLEQADLKLLLILIPGKYTL
jgi:hypothetical protein